MAKLPLDWEIVNPHHPARGGIFVGDKFNRLTAVEYVGLVRKPNSKMYPYWLWKCDCGELFYTFAARVKHGNTKSCGCLLKEIYANPHNKTHNRKGTSEYNTWVQMRARCRNPKDPAWNWYGGRGIRVCSRWDESFEAFLKDMGERPSKKHSIDRIDNDGHYEPGNCRWATRKEQQANQSSNQKLMFHGKAETLANVAEALGTKGARLKYLLLAGFSIDEIEKRLMTGENFRKGKPMSRKLLKPDDVFLPRGKDNAEQKQTPT